VFDLTDKGHALYKKSADRRGLFSRAGGCAGHILLGSVDRFTGPVAQSGAVHTWQGTFTARAEYDDWAKVPTVHQAFRDELGHTEPVSLMAPTVLMNDSWTLHFAPP
jgi:hypothetical protein